MWERIEDLGCGLLRFVEMNHVSLQFVTSYFENRIQIHMHQKKDILYIYIYVIHFIYTFKTPKSNISETQFHE